MSRPCRRGAVPRARNLDVFARAILAFACATLVSNLPLAADEPVGADPDLRASLVARAQEAAGQSWQTAFSPSATSTFGTDGLALTGVTDDQPWQMNLRLASFGRRGAVSETRSRLLRTDVHRAEVDHQGVREWVVGSRGRLTHGFVLDQSPFRVRADGSLEAGSGDVVFDLELSGDFVAERGQDGESVVLRHGRTVFAYKDLVARDAEGRQLPARLKVTETGIQLRVDAFAASYPLFLAVNVDQVAKLLPTSSLIELAGWRVDISGDIAAVSAHFANVGIHAGAGKVYLFQRDLGGPNNWGLLKEVISPAPVLADRFGHAVAIDGNYLAVGAFRADDSFLLLGTGRVFIYERNTGGINNWGHVKSIDNPTPAFADHFGWSVDISGDTVVAGANFAEQSGTLDTGEAYVFRRDQGGAGNWGLVATLTAPLPAQNLSYFGRSVTISGDTVAVGARFRDVDSIDDGAVYVFERDLGGAEAWGLAASLDADDGSLGDLFGFDVDLDGDVLVVGADWADAPQIDSGAAYIFERDAGGPGNWGQTRKLTASDGGLFDHFGRSVAVQGDVILVGAHLDGPPLVSGSAYLFRRDQGGADNWGEVERFVASDAAAADYFGYSLALDGDTFVVGAFGESISGSAYVFGLDPRTDLSVSVASTPDPVAPGGSVTYTVTVTNNGTDDAENVTVGTVAGPDAGTGTTSVGCAEDPNGFGSCSLGTLAAGASVQFTLTRPVDAMAMGTLTLEATVTSSTVDPSPLNNIAVESTAVSGGGGGMADISLLKTDSADPIAPGATLTYSLAVLNNGPDDALNVVLVDTLPAGLSGAVTTGCAESPGGVGGCSLGTVEAGSSKSVTLTVTVDAVAGTTLNNTATVSSDTEDPNFANNTATESTTVGAGTADLVISMDDDVDPVNAGDMLTYTVEVANLAGDTATGVTVTLTLPGSVTAPATVGCVEDPNGIPTCTLPDIDPGTFETFTVTVTTDAGVFDPLIAQATVASDADDPNLGNNTTTESTTVAAAGEADLWVIQLDSADPVDMETQMTYTILVGNYGPSTAQDVVLTDVLPDNFFAPVAMGCEGGALPVCELGTLAPGEVKTVTLTGTVLEIPGTGDTMSHPVSVVAANPDPDTANNSAIETTTVTGSPGQADLLVSVEDGVDPVTAGDNLVYTVQVVNLGPHVASAVTVASVLPAGVGAAISSGCAEDPAGGASCNLGNLSPGLPVFFTLTVPVDLQATGPLAMVVTADSATQDPTPANNTDMESTAVAATAVADLAVTFSAGDDTAAPGGTADYEVTITNLGTDDAANATLTLAVTGPAGTAVTTGCAEDPGGVPTCTLGTLASGASTVVTVSVPVNAGATGSLQIDVSGSSDASDPNLVDNAASYTTLIDAVPPTVTLLNTVGDTGDGTLDLCEEARVAVSELKVTFSEAMDETLAADPGSYRLIAAGADQDVDTRQCDTLEGDDSVYTFASVAYDAGTLTTTLTAESLLPDGPYRLLVCDSVTDAAGNALDGDEDATAGVDFRRYFRVDTKNLFTEGHFDCNLDEWERVANSSLDITYTAFDVDSARVSGAAVFYNNDLANTDYSLGQCVPLGSRGGYELGAEVWIRDLETDVTVRRTCTLYAQADCTGAATVTETNEEVFTTVTGGWQPLPTWSFEAPAGTASALCSLDLSLANSAAEITILVDDLVLTSLIFGDGFETGDTSRWSATSP